MLRPPPRAARRLIELPCPKNTLRRGRGDAAESLLKVLSLGPADPSMEEENFFGPDEADVRFSSHKGGSADQPSLDSGVPDASRLGGVVLPLDQGPPTEVGRVQHDLAGCTDMSHGPAFVVGPAAHPGDGHRGTVWMPCAELDCTD